jgi:glutamate dehydrogenase/leucine dehydrogenase
MSDWNKFTDALGPEKIVHIYDPKIGLKGVVVVDTTSLVGAAGGTRMLPDITTREIFGLARAMTYKFAMLDFPIGGAKAGIWAVPEAQGSRRKEFMLAFGAAVKPLLASGLTLAADMGTDNDDVATFFEGAGLPSKFTGLSLQQIEGEPLEDHCTGYGVVVAARAACSLAGLDLKGARVAIEGFGKVGGGVARYMHQAGGKVVAISNIHGTAYSEQGLNIPELLQSKKKSGDRALQDYRKARKLKSGALYTLPVDILIPGARPYVITKKNAQRVKAKIISSIANIPITDEAEDILFDRGILSVPDFISNAGGVVLGVVDALGGTADDVFRILRDFLGPLTGRVLTEAKEQKQVPRKLAVSQATQKVLDARKEPASAIDLTRLMDDMKKRLKMV